jgi:micrococcal nuclease
VIDGDTVELSINLGFHISRIVVVRVEGVNTPEIHGNEREAGLVSKSYTKSWLNKYQMYTVLASREIDKYGRVLGDFVPRPDLAPPNNFKTLSESLIAEGLAKPYSGGTRIRYTPKEINEVVKWEIKKPM